MSFDPHTNLAYTLLTNSPGMAGTSFAVTPGTGAYFPASGSFNCTVWPAGVIPTQANAEIVRVTAVSGDTLTVTRAQESTSAVNAQPGFQFMLSITAKDLTDIEAKALGGNVTGPASSTDGDVALFSGTTGQLIKDSTAPFTPTGIGLGNVTNDAQTKAAVMPNTAPTAGQIPVGNAGGTAYAAQSVSGDGRLSSAGVLNITGINGEAIIPGSGTGAASYGALPVMFLMLKNVAAQTSGGAADIASIPIPAGITRWRLLGSTGNVGNCVVNESSSSASTAAFTIYTAANAGGSAVTASFAGPGGNALVNFGAASSVGFFTATSIFVHQTANSGNATNLSFYLGIVPLN